MKSRIDTVLKCQQWDRVRTADGQGSRTVRKADDLVCHAFEIEIDLEALVLQLGQKALRGKSGKSRLAGGKIVVRCLERHTEPAAETTRY